MEKTIILYAYDENDDALVNHNYVIDSSDNKFVYIKKKDGKKIQKISKSFIYDYGNAPILFRLGSPLHRSDLQYFFYVDVMPKDMDYLIDFVKDFTSSLKTKQP